MAFNKYKVSDKLQKQYDEIIQQPIKKYDKLQIKLPQSMKGMANVIAISDEYCDGDPKRVKVSLLNNDGSYSANNRVYTVEVTPELHANKSDLYDTGADPIPEHQWDSKLTRYQSDLQSIIFRIDEAETYSEVGMDGEKHDIPNITWNPFVYDWKGNKYFYQRDFVWTEEEMQNFLDSIYNGINCGEVILRERPDAYIADQFEKGNYEAGWWDVVDGKQRLHTLMLFVTDQITDRYGNHYSDLSRHAKQKFCNSKSLSYCTLGIHSSDEDTIDTFLHVNISGVPQEGSHIEDVRAIKERLLIAKQ